MTLSRRRVLALLAAIPVPAVACSPEPSSSRSSTASPAAPTLSTSRAPSATGIPQGFPSLQDSVWQPTAGEVAPQIKRVAAAFLEAAGNWEDPTSYPDLLTRLGAAPEAAAGAEILWPAGALASSLTVVYPQYGGITADTAAVIALVDQTLRTTAGITRRQLALDVRLAVLGGAWSVQRVNPLTTLGAPIALTDTAVAVLNHPRIVLSEPAVQDITTGRVDATLLRVLAGLASTQSITIQVIHTGHIQTVYPSPKLSNHAVGRAADIREIDGVRIVDHPSKDILGAFMRRASDLGATEVGGPIDLNGTRPGFFTDDVHRDHIHIGVTPGDLPAHRR